MILIYYNTLFPWKGIKIGCGILVRFVRYSSNSEMVGGIALIKCLARRGFGESILKNKDSKISCWGSDPVREFWVSLTVESPYFVPAYHIVSGGIDFLSCMTS